MYRLIAMVLMAVCTVAAAASIPGFEKSEHFDEQVREEKLDSGVRVVFNAPSAASFDPAKPTQFVIYTLPNGNTIEQTLGCKLVEGLDWHYDIQHIAAQTRRLREIDRQRNIVIACLEA